MSIRLSGVVVARDRGSDDKEADALLELDEEADEAAVVVEASVVEMVEEVDDDDDDDDDIEDGDGDEDNEWDSNSKSITLTFLRMAGSWHTSDSGSITSMMREEFFRFCEDDGRGKSEFRRREKRGSAKGRKWDERVEREEENRMT